MQQWARSVWLGQCAAAGNAHFRLAKVVEPRRYPARSLTRFVGEGPRGCCPRSRLTEFRATTARNPSHWSFPMGIARTLRFTGYVYHTATRSKLLSRESRQPAGGVPAFPRREFGITATKSNLSPCPLSTRRHDRRSSWNACETRRLCPWRAGKSVRLFEPKVGKSKGRFICAYRSHRPRYRTPLPN
jgi:hypothetical protein